jgi:two-component system sensor histidine kinase TctE
MGKRRPSIRRSLLSYLGALFLMGTASLFLAALGYGRSAANLSYDRLLKASALSIAENVASVDGRVRVDLPYAALDLLAMAPEDRVFYRVATGNGRTVIGYRDLPTAPHRVASEEPLYFDAPYAGEMVRFVALSRFVADPATRGWALVQVGQTRRSRAALTREIVWRATLPIAALTLIALALVWFGVRHAMAPLIRIEHELLAREPSELQPLAGPVPIELTALIDSLNRFMARLATNHEALQAFIGEASHQMRTPLASVRAQAQIALDEEDPAQLRRSLEAIERNSTHLSRLLNQLLSDTTVVHRAEVRHLGELDLAQVVEQAIQQVLPQFGSPPELRIGCTGDTRLRGDALMLGEAVKNLVDNALCHGTSEHRVVEIEVHGHADHCSVSVSDRGPGIEPLEAERVFERFARGRNAAVGGAGLGLAIVRRVVESHDGRLSLENRTGGGLTVRMELPRPCQ